MKCKNFDQHFIPNVHNFHLRKNDVRGSSTHLTVSLVLTFLVFGNDNAFTSLENSCLVRALLPLAKILHSATGSPLQPFIVSVLFTPYKVRIVACVIRNPKSVISFAENVLPAEKPNVTIAYAHDVCLEITASNGKPRFKRAAGRLQGHNLSRRLTWADQFVVTNGRSHCSSRRSKQSYFFSVTNLLHETNHR